MRLDWLNQSKTSAFADPDDATTAADGPGSSSTVWAATTTCSMTSAPTDHPPWSRLQPLDASRRQDGGRRPIAEHGALHGFDTTTADKKLAARARTTPT